MEQQARSQDTLYTSLDPDSRQIRLFTLLPGAFKDPIKGFLTEVSLENDPEYEALSYVWGDPNVTLPIHLGGCGPDLSKYLEFGVTTNLESALRHLRLKHASRRLWIDAICINQMDILERNHQVKNMKWVYGAASMVLFWLGNFTIYSSRGLKLLLEAMTTDCVFDNVENREMTHHYIQDIMSRDYWRRIWVVQEFALAKRVRIVCGPFAIEVPASGCLERMNMNIQGLTSANMDRDMVGLSLLRLLHILEIQEEQRLSRASLLWELVWRFLPCESRDLRDKVFALLGLVSDLELGMNNPDYSLTFKVVTNRFVRSSVQLRGNLNLLNLASGASSVADHPSWLFDWSKTDAEHAWEQRYGCSFVPFEPSRRSRFRKFQASGELRPIFVERASSSSQLTLRGFTLDKIHYLGSRYENNPLELRPVMNGGVPRLLFPTLWAHNEYLWKHFERHSPNFQQCSSHVLLDFQAKGISPYASPLDALLKGMENIWEAFWRTNIADSVVHGSGNSSVDGQRQSLHGTRPDENFGRTIATFTNSLESGPLKSSDFDADVTRAIESAMAGRRFFLSNSGWMGLAPAAAKTGDTICILIGGATPFVLRPAGEGVYQLIGECYVHGVMDGEALVDLSNGKYELQDVTLV